MKPINLLPYREYKAQFIYKYFIWLIVFILMLFVGYAWSVNSISKSIASAIEKERFLQKKLQSVNSRASQQEVPDINPHKINNLNNIKSIVYTFLNSEDMKWKSILFDGATILVAGSSNNINLILNFIEKHKASHILDIKKQNKKVNYEIKYEL